MQNVDIKKKKIQYNPYEDQEFDEFGNPKEKSLLSKYDEEISGAKKEGFRIGFDNAVERRQTVAQSVKEKLAKQKLVFIPEKNLTLASEYYNEEELAKFKKPKKKARKIRTKGKLSADELLQSQDRHKTQTDRSEFNIDDVPSNYIFGMFFEKYNNNFIHFRCSSIK